MHLQQKQIKERLTLLINFYRGQKLLTPMLNLLF